MEPFGLGWILLVKTSCMLAELAFNVAAARWAHYWARLERAQL